MQPKDAVHSKRRERTKLKNSSNKRYHSLNNEQHPTKKEGNIMKCLKSQEMRKLAPELDPLRIGTGWKPEELAMPQVIIESTAGDSHPGSGHLHILVDEVKKGIAEAGGHGAKYFCTDICDGDNFKRLLSMFSTEELVTKFEESVM